MIFFYLIFIFVKVIHEHYSEVIAFVLTKQHASDLPYATASWFTVATTSEFNNFLLIFIFLSNLL